jgi:NAD(P)-dependent dehydrogenase (short-subunit alcohol dehydrogenase family)
MRGLDGAGVLVSGGSRGIGLAAARRFLDERSRVFISGLHPTEVDAALKELRDLGTIDGMASDVSNEDDVDRLVDRAAAFLDGIDVLINNAGTAAQQPFLEMETERWDEMLAVNLRGQFLVAQRVARSMIERGGGGAIVNMASTNALEGEAGYAHYNASKGGVAMLTRTMAIELAPRGIRVNAVCPGKIARPRTPNTLGTSSESGSRWGGPARRRRSPPPTRSWLPTRHRSSTASCSSSTAASWRCEEERT